MKISKMLILGVITTIVGAALMAVGLWFSETVNPISVLGIIFGSQALTMGQLLMLKAAWRSYQETKKLAPVAS
jgi:hypothetical protein